MTILHAERRQPELTLPSGRNVRQCDVRQRADDDCEAIEIRAADGRVELAIRFTEAGPVLSFESASVELRSTRDVTVECDSFAVKAREAATIEAAEVDVTSTSGELRLTGATDAWLTAEMLLLNCDREVEMAERASKAPNPDEQPRPKRPCGCGGA